MHSRWSGATVVSAGALIWTMGAGCLGGNSSPPRTEPPDSEVADSGQPGKPDGGIDGGVDSGSPGDAGTVSDAGTISDAGSGSDAGMNDAGTSDGGIVFGGPGPWPMTNVTYGAADGILEQPVVGMTTDETQNLWVATQQALYLLQPGQTMFHRYDGADGLHVQSNPIFYCDTYMRDDNGDPLPCVNGAASDPGIAEIVGGGSGEVFVGYAGTPDPDVTCSETDASDRCDPNRHTGQLDRARLNVDGTLSVVRINMASTNHGMQYWHNRTVSRMIFDHFIHSHELYVGTNHGVDLLRPDLYAPYSGPDSSHPFDLWLQTFMGDHLHAIICYHAACVSGSDANERIGGWRGLAFDANGDVWHAGKWAAGKLLWDATLTEWNVTPRPSTGQAACRPCFGDPYPFNSGNPNFINEPVFRPPMEGDPVDLSAVSVAPDGRVWFASAPVQTGDPAYGVGVWDGHQFTVYDPMVAMGLGEEPVRDLIALPDGRIVIAGPNTGLVFWDPVTGQHVSMQAGQGIPDNHVLRLELDQMVSPPALHVSTYNGAATLRQFPQ